jgi:hypothetical protein
MAAWLGRARTLLQLSGSLSGWRHAPVAGKLRFLPVVLAQLTGM